MSGLTVRCSAAFVSQMAHVKLTRLGKVVATGTMRKLVAKRQAREGQALLAAAAQRRQRVRLPHLNIDRRNSPRGESTANAATPK